MSQFGMGVAHSIFFGKFHKTVAIFGKVIYNSINQFSALYRAVSSDATVAMEITMTISEYKEKVQGKHAAVLGYGVSNRPLVSFLLNLGVTVEVRDKKIPEPEALLQLEKQNVPIQTGSNYLDNIHADLIFRSPGIRPDQPEIQKAVENGAELTSEMELFFLLCPATTIAIPGSDGKTTTTTLVAKLLQTAGKRVFLGGNIGTPLLCRVGEMTKDDFAVLELSSFQLFTMKQSPDRAVVTNLSPNHLDWHTDMDEYARAKKNIFRYQSKTGHLVLNYENEYTRHMAKEAVAQNIRFFSSKRVLNDGICLQDGVISLMGKEILLEKDILLPGLHNRENYMAAIAATDGFVSKEDIFMVASTFTGVEHRLETVRVHHGVRYINSSIDSSPSRTSAALGCFSNKVICICGGYDKNIPFAPLADALCRHAKSVVLTGATAEKIKAALDACEETEKPAIIMEDDFKTAVLKASEIAAEGDIVILSPACASFDAFKNFMERGNAFRAIISELE